MSGLAQLISNLTDDNSTAEGLRHSLRAQNRKIFDSICCTERLRYAASGKEAVWVFAEPGPLLALLVEKSAALTTLYEDAWARHPSSYGSPWSAVVGFDEFLPGNNLATDQARKTMVLSFSFLELGGKSLSHGSTWVTPVVVRSHMIGEARKRQF